MARWVSGGAPHHPDKQRGEILLVDDEPKVRFLVQNFLELKGFAVAAAGSGEEALERLARAVPTVVILDIKMPGMDGLETLRHLRATHPTLPVVFLTQVDEDQARLEALTLGVHEYITKPFDFERLERILRTQIGA